jgi:hypothetical protein
MENEGSLPCSQDNAVVLCQNVFCRKLATLDPHYSQFVSFRESPVVFRDDNFPVIFTFKSFLSQQILEAFSHRLSLH